MAIIGRIMLLLLMILWCVNLFSSEPWIFIDFFNLALHELGHLVFSPFGEFMGFLGGTIGQLIFPVVFLIAFIRKSDRTGTGFALFWLGENLVNIGRYMSDARARVLPLLVDGSTHDWWWLFGKLDLLEYDRVIGSSVRNGGLALCILAICLIAVDLVSVLATRFRSP
jgi:hypothetical protein